MEPGSPLKVWGTRGVRRKDLQEPPDGPLVIRIMQPGDGLGGFDPFEGVVLGAERRRAPRGQFGPERVEPPASALRSLELDLPVEREQSKEGLEAGLFPDLPADRGRVVRVLGIDLTADRDPDPPPLGRAANDQQTQRGANEEVGFDALLVDWPGT